MKCIRARLLGTCLVMVTTAAAAETAPEGFTPGSLFQQLHDQFQPDGGSDPTATGPDFQGMVEEGHRQLRMGIENRPGRAFSADSLFSMHQGSRYMTLRLDEGLSDECLAPTTVRLSNQSVSGPLQVQQFIDREWDLLAFYDADSCRVLDVELVQPGMADAAIDQQLEP